MNEFDEFLAWEKVSRDTIDFKKIYVDMANDLIAGLMLSQIIYWHLPKSNGESKLKVEKDGYLWIAKSASDWYDEVRITKWQVPRALKILEDKGIIETKLYKFNGTPVTHIRIIIDKFMELWANHLNGFEGKPKIHLRENLKSLTKTTTENTSCDSKTSNEEITSQTTIIQPASVFSSEEIQPLPDTNSERLESDITSVSPNSSTRTKVSSSELYRMALVLAEVCKMPFEPNKGRLMHEAKLIMQDTRASPEFITMQYAPGGAWYSQDWRGKRGQAPTPSQIRATLFSFVPEGGPKIITGSVKDRDRIDRDPKYKLGFET